MDDVLDEALLVPLLDLFYARVRADMMLGPIFEEAVDDWPAHLDRLRDFWSSVMLTTGRYKGNPVALHLAHAPRMVAGMFERWLELWRVTTNEMLPARHASAMQGKAARIAESLQLALKLHAPGGRQAMLGRSAPDRPYRSTPVFDQDTLPAALRSAHSTKAGVWGVIRVLEGRLRYRIEASGTDVTLDPDTPGRIRPCEVHHVEPLGAMRMQVDFYDHEPAAT
jgi:truncated hemoglobin YjbI/tellurite resistance-related uncharacterized protein